MDKSVLTIRIQNLRLWKSNNWVKYSTINMCDSFLRLHFDQLLITTENKVLESINLSSKIKGVFKQDYVILIVLSVGGEVSTYVGILALALISMAKYPDSRPRLCTASEIMAAAVRQTEERVAEVRRRAEDAVNQTRKIKFQIKDNLEQNLKELAKKFPLVAYNNISSNRNTSANVFQSTEEVLKGLIDKEVTLPPLPASPELDHLLKLCILDPLFPQTVMKIQSAIEKKMTQ